MTRLVNRIYGPTIECEPGEATDSTGHCERHSSHYFCETCQGYYGVPHTGIHEGEDAHPNRFYWDCACRMCFNHRESLRSAK